MSLTSVTDHLTSSHLHSLPASGTFLAPHYLLLCHIDGLDVLPLTSPPAPRPYALVRRVCFKNVVVMEERGVLVAIAGRRDGVRVYALEEVKKAVKWRVDLEIKREKENKRNEDAKGASIFKMDKADVGLKRKDTKTRSKGSLVKSRSETLATPQVKQKKSGTYEKGTPTSMRHGLEKVRSRMSTTQPPTPTFDDKETISAANTDSGHPPDAFDGESEDGGEHGVIMERETLTLAQILMESRLPNLGPPGTRVPHLRKEA